MDTNLIGGNWIWKNILVNDIEIFYAYHDFENYIKLIDYEISKLYKVSVYISFLSRMNDIRLFKQRVNRIFHLFIFIQLMQPYKKFNNR